jgi:hypothetical protein
MIMDTVILMIVLLVLLSVDRNISRTKEELVAEIRAQSTALGQIGLGKMDTMPTADIELEEDTTFVMPDSHTDIRHPETFRRL